VSPRHTGGISSRYKVTLTFEQGPGKRSPILEEMCQEYLADFESNLELLVAVNTKLESRIDLKKRHQKSVHNPNLAGSLDFFNVCC
jgi:hypothetical protein